MESDSAKSAKFSIVRKLCQPGVYVLVSVVASFYVSGRGSTQQKSQLSRSTSKALAKKQKSKSNKAKAKKAKKQKQKSKSNKVLTGPDLNTSKISSNWSRCNWFKF